MSGKLAKENKVVFVSEDGQHFQLFIDGKEISATQGVEITAGDGGFVKVTSTLVCSDQFRNIE